VITIVDESRLATVRDSEDRGEGVRERSRGGEMGDGGEETVRGIQRKNLWGCEDERDGGETRGNLCKAASLIG
jgi:hypothetical protein